MKKYELTDEVITINGITLHRIKALKDFGVVKAGDLGGYVEREVNLGLYGNAWVYGNAVVFGNAKVRGNAEVSGNVWVSGNAEVRGNAVVSDKADYIVFKNWWSSGRFFTWTRSNDKWCVGCFCGSGDELIAKAYQDSQKSGDNYKKIVEYVNSIKKQRL